MGGRYYTPEEDQIIRQRAGVLPAQAIADLLKRDRRAVIQRARCLGVSLQLRGERHHRAKQPDAAVNAALRLHASDVPAESIASRTGLPLRYVRRLLAGDIRPGAGAL